MKSTGRIYNNPEHRNTFEGIFYRLRTGIPWRDLPKKFGSWSAIFRRFNLWSKKGVLSNLFNELAKDSDFDWVFIDGSIVRAHQHSTGAATDDSDLFRQFIESEGMESVSPKRKYNGEKQKDVDWCLYKYRHLVENAFGRIKHFLSISTRYDKLARNYASMVSLACSMMWLPMYC